MNKKMLTATIYCISMFQMGMVVLSPVVASITEAFPGTSQTTAQMAITFLCLVLVIAALFSGKIVIFLGRKLMAAFGMILTVAAGIGGVLLTGALWTVFLWSAILGAGIGLFVPAASSLVMEFFEGREREIVAGLQTAFLNLGGMLLSFLSGLLAAIRWQNAYLVFLAAAPVIFLTLRFVPGKSGNRDTGKLLTPGESADDIKDTDEGLRPDIKNISDAKNAGSKKFLNVPGIVWLATVQAIIFAIFYFAFSTNISLLLVERGIGSTSLSGTATSAFMLGGCIFGLIYAKAAPVLKTAAPSFSFFLVTASYLIIYFSDGIIPLMIAAFIGGGSLSIIFPFYLTSVAGRIDPAVTVASSSLIFSVGPNFGSFISPVIITNLVTALFSPAVDARFLFAAICSAVLGAVLIFVNRRVFSYS